jgi:hypothetical protein
MILTKLKDTMAIRAPTLAQYMDLYVQNVFLECHHVDIFVECHRVHMLDRETNSCKDLILGGQKQV